MEIINTSFKNVASDIDASIKTINDAMALAKKPATVVGAKQLRDDLRSLRDVLQTPDKAAAPEPTPAK